MKKAIFAGLVFGLALLAQAQAPAPDDATQYTPEQIDELVAPIALYPDPLVAIILPASTAPSDVVLADRYLAAGYDPAQAGNQPWDDSVKALVNYPQVLSWMNDNLDWTTALGRAFLQQPTQVMESIQQLRAQARANGALVDTPQQHVVVDGSSILIQPVSDDTIYVPQYDCDLVFGTPGVVFTETVVTFGPPCRVGAWLCYECDWDDFGIWLGTWRPGWAYIREWRQPGVSARGGFWRPDNVHQRELLRTVNRPIVAAPPRPHPMAGAPTARPGTSPGFHPATTRPPSRPDPRGWRQDSDGSLAVRPAPANKGPNITLSGGGPAQPVRPVQPQNVQVTPVRPAPVETTPTRTTPIQTTPIRTTPIETRPITVSPAPAPPVRTAPAAGNSVFGGYTRGADANQFSNRGQASLNTIHPAPASPPPQARPAPAPPPAQVRSAPPPAPSGSNGTGQRH